MKKKIIFLILIAVIILVFILVKLEYKGANSGNNISKSDKIDILNISSYEAIVTAEVYSNKNTNKYIMKQKYLQPNAFWQEVIEPSNLKGLTISQIGEKVSLENKNLSLKTIYENFNGNCSNLNLVSFINNYKEGIETETNETDVEIIMKTKITKSQNKYQMYQNLYISKETALPTKMEILDINKNVTVYILYNEIKFNQVDKESLF